MSMYIYTLSSPFPPAPNPSQPQSLFLETAYREGHQGKGPSLSFYEKRNGSKEFIPLPPATGFFFPEALPKEGRRNEERDNS